MSDLAAIRKRLAGYKGERSILEDQILAQLDAMSGAMTAAENALEKAQEHIRFSGNDPASMRALAEVIEALKLLRRSNG